MPLKTLCSKTLGLGLALGAAALTPSASTTAQCQVAELSTPGLAITHGLGVREGSLSLDGDRLAAGDAEDDQIFQDSGAVTLFRRVAGVWEVEAQLFASDPRPVDRFGHAVSLQGDRLLIGAPGKDSTPGGVQVGAVYEFRLVDGEWVEQSLILPQLPGTSDLFGWSVDLDGARLAVGDIGGTSPGVAHVFRLEGGAWVHEQRIDPGTTGPLSFGIDVDLQGDRLVVGAMQDSEVGLGAGAAFIYERKNAVWEFQAKLRPPPGDFSQFGFSVAFAGPDVIAVGAPRFSGDTDLSGALFVFELSGNLWQTVPLLDAPTAAFADGLGMATAGRQGLILVGHPGEDTTAAGSGAMHAFRPDDGGWRFAGSLKASDAGVTDRLGSAITNDGEVTAVSAPYHDGVIMGAGAVFVFGGMPGSPVWNSADGAVSGGGSPCLYGDGSLEPDSDVTLTLIDGAPGVAATLVVGGSELGLPFKGGVLVPAPEVFVAPLPIGAAGVLELVGALPVGTPSGFQLVAQLWWPDAGAPAGFAASNGVIGTVP